MKRRDGWMLHATLWRRRRVGLLLRKTEGRGARDAEAEQARDKEGQTKRKRDRWRESSKEGVRALN